MAWVRSCRRAAVQRDIALAGQGEGHHQHGAGLAGGAVGDVLLHMVDARIGQQGDVELRGLLGLALEPEAGGDLGHGGSSWVVRAKDDRDRAAADILAERNLGWRLRSQSPAQNGLGFRGRPQNEVPAMKVNRITLYAVAAEVPAGPDALRRQPEPASRAGMPGREDGDRCRADGLGRGRLRAALLSAGAGGGDPGRRAPCRAPDPGRGSDQGAGALPQDGAGAARPWRGEDRARHGAVGSQREGGGPAVVRSLGRADLDRAPPSSPCCPPAAPRNWPRPWPAIAPRATAASRSSCRPEASPRTSP